MREGEAQGSLLVTLCDHAMISFSLSGGHADQAWDTRKIDEENAGLSNQFPGNPK